MIELRGDEALCAFKSTRQALRTAVQLQIRFREQVDGMPVFPLGVGIGLDAGEAVPVEDGYRGGALNLAARLCSVAAPGQILASDTVASLARRLEGARFVERRPVRLKGLDKPVRVIEVVPDVPLPPLPETRKPRSRRRMLALAAAAAAVVAAALAAALLTLTGGSGDASGQIGNAIAAVDPDGNVSYTLAGTTPSTIAVGEGAVWVLNADDRTISKLDPASGQIVKTFGTGGTTTDLAVGEGSVWIGNGSTTEGTAFGSISMDSVSQLDPSSTEVRSTFGLPALPSGSTETAGGTRVLGVSQLAVGAGAVWAINPDRTISRINVRTGRRKTIPVKASGAIAAGKNGVWLIAGEEVVRIDSETKKVAQRIEVPAESLWALAVGGGSVWTTDLSGGLLWRLDPERPPRPIDVGFGVTSVAYGGGDVWVTNFVRDELVRVDARTNRVTARIPIAGTPPSVAATKERAWVSVAGAPRGDVLPASACGPVRDGGRSPDVLMASDLPLQGPTGEVMRLSVASIMQVLREHDFRAGAHTVGYQSCDDSTAQAGGYDILKCASNAKAYAATPRVVGVVGPIFSPCAWAQIPIANRAEGPLAMISPANTHPGLTHHGPESEPDEPSTYYPAGVRNYVRVTGPSDYDGAAGAVLADELGLRRVYVLRSNGGIGDETTAPFRRAAKRLGLTIAGSAVWDLEAASYSALADRVAAARPDGVFVGDGVFANGGAIVKALRARLGPKTALIAGDSFQPPSVLLEQAGRAAVGMYVTTTAAAAEGLGPAGQRFLREFRRTQGEPIPSAFYVIETAAAAEALLAAIARSDGTRESVTRELRGLELDDGILGSFRFDRNGDITPAAFTVIRFTGQQKAGRGLPEDYAGTVVDRVVRVPLRLLAEAD